MILPNQIKNQNESEFLKMDKKETSKPEKVNPFSNLPDSGDSVSFTDSELCEAIQTACIANGSTLAKPECASIREVAELIGKSKGIDNTFKIEKKIRTRERNLTGKVEKVDGVPKVHKVGNYGLMRMHTNGKVYLFSPHK